MNIAIRTRHLTLEPETHEKLRDRIQRALGRITQWVLTVDVTLTDINGPKGGADKLCRLRVRGRGAPSVVSEHVGADVLATAAFAAGRAEQMILRKVARRRPLSQT
jgi:putative sigma-54 modulation protein